MVTTFSLVNKSCRDICIVRMKCVTNYSKMWKVMLESTDGYIVVIGIKIFLGFELFIERNKVTYELMCY